MLKKLLGIFAVFALVLAANPQTSLAQSREKKHFDKEVDLNSNADLPQEEGIYKIKGRPDLKMQVFVYRAKPAPAPALTLTCNLSDPDSSAVVAGAGWKLPSNWVYRLNTSGVPSLVGSQNLPTIADNAFGVWKSAISNKVSITRGFNTTVNKARFDSQNIIAWGRAPSSALAVSYVWYYPSTGLAAEIDTIMNKSFTWAWSNPQSWVTSPNTTCAYKNVYDAQDILTHELGHTMGLDDVYTSNYADNTMYGYGSTMETKKDTLTTGDKVGVETLYP